MNPYFQKHNTKQAAYLDHLIQIFPGTRIEELAQKAESLLPTCYYPASIESSLKAMIDASIKKGFIGKELNLTRLSKLSVLGLYLPKVGLPNYGIFAEGELARIVDLEQKFREEIKDPQLELF